MSQVLGNLASFAEVAVGTLLLMEMALPVPVVRDMGTAGSFEFPKHLMLTRERSMDHKAYLSPSILEKKKDIAVPGLNIARCLLPGWGNKQLNM